MKKLSLFCLVVSLVLISCGKTTPTNQMTEQANIVQTMVATLSQITTPEQTMPAPTNPGGTPIPTKSGPNPEHLAKLMEGVDAWNEWRTQNPEIKPDLIKAILQRVNLTRANLSRANLMGANLRGAILIKANLKLANLINANLIGANLTGAILTEAKLTYAKYDSRTKWPEGFDPVAAGAKLIVLK